MTADGTTTREVQAIVTYRTCAGCGAELPVHAQVPGGWLHRSRSKGDVACSPKCRTRAMNRRRRDAAPAS